MRLAAILVLVVLIVGIAVWYFIYRSNGAQAQQTNQTNQFIAAQQAAQQQYSQLFSDGSTLNCNPYVPFSKCGFGGNSSFSFGTGNILSFL